jgi:2-polyprenyl-3-methyl-5-hydroxy-6-metoxy-1,4-benzoquinol methylase
MLSAHRTDRRVAEMKYTDVAETYDRLFKDNTSLQIRENLNNGEPFRLVKALENFVTSGDVLDIGAGVGHNSIYLASRGFNVLATDISAVAIERLGARAKGKAVSIRTRIHDIGDEELDNHFDVIICTAVLHHLQTDDALSVIKKIKEHTKPMGFNIIGSFTKRGSLYSNNPETKRFFPGSNEELNRLY